MTPNEITCPRVILCEGAGDASFLRHLIQERDLPDFYITYPNHSSFTDPGGRDGFTNRLRALKLLRGFDQVSELVVISDNDDAPAKKFAEVVELIRKAEGFQIPNQPAVLVNGKPSIGIYMLPESNVPGQLETLCLQSCRAQWEEISACLDSYVACNRHLSTWDTGKQEKMKMRILISTICSTDPYTSLPHAWSRTDEIIPLNHQCFNGLADFLASIPSQAVLPR